MVTKKKPAPKAKKATAAKSKAKAKAPVKAKASPKKAIAKKAAPKKVVAKKKPAAKKAAPKKKPVAKKDTPKKVVAKKKPAAKKAVAKKTTPKKKPVAKKAAPKKVVAKKKPVAKKAAPKKAPAKKKPAVKKSKSQAITKPRDPNAHFEVSEFTPYKMKRGEEYMNEAQRDHFKNILLNWRNELMEEVDRTVHHMQDEAANPPDPADRATLEEEFSIELRTRDRERRLIKKIDSTIEMIAKNDYGFCDSCGVEIGIRRLEARPTANKCIDCKTLDEIKEKQLGA
ncbi:MAG: RNA polymerase-binding protein DksA [Gammaproteobacteria bacterium]|jgi:DnaK suppressor protein|nr:RNA polymerase-binding protein DksA [Gammaproteobacteria bacterium]